jgi:hypothetical protein
LVKARTQVARVVEAVEEDDLFNDDIPGEMSESLNSIRNLFGAIPDKYFKQIYHDKFDPKNIIRLSQPLGSVQESQEDETKLDITANTIRIRRTTASLKEYGSTTTHWSRAFGVYAAILCSFFTLKYPSLPTAILHFGWQIETLSESFSWQEACLPLAIAALERVRTQGRLYPSSWNISQSLVTNYCRWDRLKETSRAVTRPRPQSNQPSMYPSGPSTIRLNETTNNNKVTCNKFRELGFCPWPGSCQRRHTREDNSQANKRPA